MRKILRLPKCPYCHKKISYVGSQFLKTKGEYSCESCKCISNVYISKVAYALASFVCIIALLVVVLYSIMGDPGNIIGVIFVLIPFVIFYLLVPLLVRLVPCKDKSAVKKLQDKAIPNIPSENAYNQAAVHNKTNPVKLDVEEGFSAKFMKAKNKVHNPDTDSENEAPENDENMEHTKVAIDIGEKNKL